MFEYQRGGGGAGSTGMGRGRNDLITTGPPVTFPERSVVQTPLLITADLSELVERSHRYDRCLRRSVFCLEQPAPKQDIERYSDRYLKQAQKPNVRSLLHGDAWDAFPEELRPSTKTKGVCNGASAAQRQAAGVRGFAGSAKKPKVAIFELLSSLEKGETQRSEDVDDAPKDNEKEDLDEDEEEKINGDAEQDDEEDLDDYIEDYAGDDYDALGSESGGDDY